MRRRWILLVALAARGAGAGGVLRTRRQLVRGRHGVDHRRRLGHAPGHGRDAGQPGAGAHRDQGAGGQPALRAGVRAGGQGLLVVTQGDDQLHEIDTATHQVLREVAVGVEPDAVAVAPGGSGGKGVALWRTSIRTA